MRDWADAVARAVGRPAAVRGWAEREADQKVGRGSVFEIDQLLDAAVARGCADRA